MNYYCSQVFILQNTCLAVSGDQLPDQTHTLNMHELGNSINPNPTDLQGFHISKFEGRSQFSLSQVNTPGLVSCGSCDPMYAWLLRPIA